VHKGKKQNANFLSVLASLGFIVLIIATSIAIYQDWVAADMVLRRAEVPPSYTTKVSDTWESIANQFGVSVDSLKDKNPELTATTEFTTGITISLPSSKETYTVKYRDTLQSIARQKKVPVARLKAYNQIEEAADFKLLIGQELVIPPRNYVKDHIPLWSILYAGLFVIALWLAIWSWQERSGKKVRDIARGDAGRYSVSKLQMFLWTACFVFTYIIVTVARKLNSEEFITEIPEALLALMGISVATFSSAKAIMQGKRGPATTTLSETTETDAPAEAENSKGAADLIQDSEGNTDVSSVQLLIWTIIGVGLYLFQVMSDLRTTNGVGLKIPDVDGTILALTIASSGGYLARQFIWRKPTSPVVRVEMAEQTAADGQVTQTLYLYGPNFGKYSSAPSQNRIEIRQDTPDKNAPWAIFEVNDPGKDWTLTLLRGQARIDGNPLKFKAFTDSQSGDFIFLKARLAEIDYPEQAFKVFAR